jgi:DNA-directed RNA polymerase II subunit RPB1
VPRIEEILRLTKNPKNPSLTVHLKPLDEGTQDRAVQFANMMEHTKLIDVVKSIKICFDPNEQTTLIDEDKLLMEQFNEFENMLKECNETAEDDVTNSAIPTRSKWIVRMEMDAETLLDKNITMDDIHFAIKNSYYGKEISCVYSDYNMDKLVFRIRMNSSVFKKKDKKTKGQLEYLDQSDEIYLLKNFQDSMLNNIVLRGVNGIENVIPRKLQNMVVKDETKYSKKDVWILDTTGSNLLETLALDYIDNTRTFSNDIKEVFNILGIEAARQVLYNEFAEVMEFADVYINYHHLSLLCDRMTCTQNMVSIFRSGILNDDIGPIAKGTFEVHTEVFLNAARHGDFDHMRGVSANVMCGQYGLYGTNAFNVVLDVKEMMKLSEANLDESNTSEEIEAAFVKSMENKMGECSAASISIVNNIQNINTNNATICDDDYNMGF